MKISLKKLHQCLGAMILLTSAVAMAQNANRPNIVMIMADDIGPANVGIYTHGLMVPTPNIDRLAKEGMLFTDHYAEPSCTSGRAAFITGQMPIRTGLTTVGLPGSHIGIDKRDPTLAEILKSKGYRTAHFGKSHLGDRDEHLPHNHGFDEFFGNLYHLNAEEEPEQRDYPTKALTKYKPRGIIEAYAGKPPQDRGPLTVKRMETIDDVVTDRSLKFMETAAKAKEPFFLWHNSSRMHVWTHLKPESRYLAQPYSSEEDIYGSGMIELDNHVGLLLKKLDELGLTKNTIVMFTSDNGPQSFTWPDGGTTPFRGEKASTWEGGYRVPMLIRWPAQIKAGSVSNGIQSHYDLFTTLASAAGVPNIASVLKNSHNVRIDGVDNIEHWRGNQASARNSFIYYNERELVGVRIGPWKGMLKERNGFFDPLKQSFAFFNLRMDPYEQRGGNESNKLALRKAWIGGQIQDLLTEHIMSLRETPPRQIGGSLRPDDATRQPPPKAP